MRTHMRGASGAGGVRRPGVAGGVAAVVLAIVSAGRALAALPCQSPIADPCVLPSQTTIPVGVYDIRPRSLDVQRQITVSGIGDFAIYAANITLEPLGTFNVSDTTGSTSI